MNFLAHILLSGDSKEVIIGNFIADAVKGKEYISYPSGIIKGILLHRKIDSYTDNHPIFNKTKTRLRTEFGKYAGVVGDIFYDHFLAANWNQYHPQPLSQYATSIYQLMEENIESLPSKVKEFLPYMIRGNWLSNYSKIEGIKRTLDGMSRRTKFESNMHLASSELLKNYQLYQIEFQKFFPEVQSFAKENLQKL